MNSAIDSERMKQIEDEQKESVKNMSKEELESAK
jgi:hypothetical protein